MSQDKQYRATTARRTRAERALRESEERYRMLVEHSPICIHEIDLNGRLTSVNQAGLKMLNAKDATEVCGAQYLDFVATEDRDRIAKLLESALKGNASKFEFAAASNNGPRVFASNFIPIKRADGSVVKLMGISQEITDRRQAEEELLQSEHRLQIVARATNDSVWDWNLVTNELWWSERYKARFGYRPEEIGPGIEARFDCIHPEDKVRVVATVHSLIESGKQFWSDEYRFRRADGSYAHVYDRGYVLHDEHGRPVRMIGAMADITARKESEDKLREYAQQLQALSRRLIEVQENERHQLAGELHDEVGQVLTSLNLALERCVPSSPEEVRGRVREVQARLNELLSRVRDLSLELRPPMLDHLGLLPALLWQCDRYVAETRVQVDFKHDGVSGQRFDPHVETAAFRIVQEALTNVARHAGVNQAIARVWANDGVIHVHVEDRGRGFNPEAAMAAGTSSGLYGMRERAQLLGGQFTIESSPGAGTRVTAELPLGAPSVETKGPGIQEEQGNEPQARGNDLSNKQ